MVKIILPTMAAYKEDLEIMLNLLERTVKGKHDIGLEIKGKPEHFLEQRYLDSIRENMAGVPQEVYRVVHGFSGIEVYESGIGDLSNDKGRAHLETLVRLGKDVGAYYINVHGGAGYQGKPLHVKRIERLLSIRRNMLECMEALVAGCELGIELLPSPSMGDMEKDPEKVLHDCAESAIDCLYVAARNIKITLDTAHYAANRKGEIGLVGIAHYALGKKLGHIHANDVSGFWVPGESVWTEGVIPGDGNIGKKSFGRFFEYIIQAHPHIGINVEVHNTDFNNPAESEKSIKRVMNWLG